MNLLKFLATIIVFYFLAILQNSFFVHLNFFGAFPNFVFIFFILLVFFSTKGSSIFGGEIIFCAIIAGLLLDIFYEIYFGVSVVILIIIGFFVKKIQLLLQERGDKYPFIYFLFLFLFSFVIYQIAFILYLGFINPLHLKINISLKQLFDIFYNIIFATIGFRIFRKFVNISDDNQLKLFR